MNKPFDLDKFKAGHKALTRGGRVATFVGICNECRASNRLVAHIHGYDPVFTYFASGIYPDEDNRYSIYDLVSMVSQHQELSAWEERTPTTETVPEPIIHCLCYNPGHVHGEFSWSPSLATKELAVANGWKIIQEWEV